MSDQTAARHSALTLAVQLAGLTDRKDIMALAETFLTFLNGDEIEPPFEAPKAAKAAPVRAAKPAPKAEAPVETVAESDAPTAEDVGKKINELLAADKQPEALAALKKYGAKSKSTLPVEHYGDFIADADKILMDA